MLRFTAAGKRQSLTKEEERRLGDGLRKALITGKPDPSRESCPNREILRDLAFHKQIGNPEAFERITAHMADCPACVRDALAYAEEYKENRKRRRAAHLRIALVIAVVLSAALWAVWRLLP